MFLLIVFGVTAIGVSFLCSIAEAVLLSVTPSYIAALEGESSGRRRATGLLLKRLKDDVDRPLAAILTANTIAHTAGAAGVGAQAQALWGSAAVTTASVVMTLLILITSEIIPKTLGAVYWRELSGVVARAVRLLIWGLYPFVLVAQAITRLLSRNKDANEVSREELGALAQLGASEGVIEEKENRMVQNLLRMQGLLARDVMTPRTVAFMLPERAVLHEVLEPSREAAFSRILLFDRDADDVTGYLLWTDLLQAACAGQHDRPLTAFRRDVLRVAEDIPLPELLERLLERREPVALVADAFGGTAGVVTTEDVVEMVLGAEILDENDKVDDLRLHARERWRRRAERRGLKVAAPEPLPSERSETAAPPIEGEGAEPTVH